MGSVGSVQCHIVPCSGFTCSQGLQVSLKHTVSSIKYRVLICCICHFQSCSPFFVYFGFLSFQVSSVSNFRPETRGQRWSISQVRSLNQNFSGGSDSKVSVYNVGDPGSIPGQGRSPGEGNGNPLQYYCLENPMDRGAWRATVHGVAKKWTRLSNFMIQKKLNFKSRLDLPYINMNPPQVYTCSLS